MDEKLLNAMFHLLQGQDFADWYNNGAFDDWLAGYTERTPDEYDHRELELKAQLKKMVESYL